MSDSDKGAPIEPSWERVATAMEGLGWSLIEKEDEAIIFQRGRQRIAARLVGKDRWNIEYYTGHIADDVAGINESRFAKLQTLIMGFIK